MNSTRIAIVGGGVMAEAIIKGLLSKGQFDRCRMTVSDPKAPRCETLRDCYSVQTTQSNRDCVEGADAVILCVKPTHLQAIGENLKGCIPPEAVVISILAGKSIALVEEVLSHSWIVRAMPNTPGKIQAGVTGWTCCGAAKEGCKNLAREILQALGTEIFFAEEKYLDMVTAVSGSGPAFVFYMMEAMEDAAVGVGLARDVARVLVIETFLGASLYSKQSGKKSFAELRHEVTSPGGTTAAGIHQFDVYRLRACIWEGVFSAYRKCIELGKK